MSVLKSRHLFTLIMKLAGSSQSRIVTIVAFIALFGGWRVEAQKTEGTVPRPASSEFRPSPEMQRLLDAFVGNWKVSESFEVSASQQGKERQGTASFRAGPGYSLIEDYESTGSAGDLRFLGLLWWDQSVRIYKLLTCVNNDGCRLRGAAKWEGETLVNSWEEKVNGKTAALKDSFVDVSPSSFRLVSEGTAGGKTIWRVITTYERIPESNH